MGRRTTTDGAKRLRKPRRRLFDWNKYDPAVARKDGRKDALTEELVTYRDHLKKLLEHQGKFVLIKGHEIVGIYELRDEALRESVDRFKDAPVLIKQIIEKEPVRELGGAVL